ncbi:MAG: hypothetical protein KDB27_26745 [Planctomycetales bacterium]|nr:hypothetical protein [Planctomycetales bacterium]
MSSNKMIQRNVNEEVQDAEVISSIDYRDAEIVGDGGLLSQSNNGESPPSSSAIRTSIIFRVLHFVAASTNWVFGFCSMIVSLAVLATIPILQFLSLGYLLEASGRIARTGRIRDGFIGIDRFARVGSIVLGTTLALMPVWFVSSLTNSSIIINGPSQESRFMGSVFVLTSLAAVGHIVWAWFRGGRLRSFFWPAPIRLIKQLKRGGWVAEARDATCEFVEGLRLPYFFMLGIRGFAGALVWLFVPVTLLAIGTIDAQPIGGLIGFVGSLATAFVVLHLPFVQARFAINNDMSEFFRLSGVRSDFRRAPVAFWMALFCTLLFALPLYLLKAELIPREAAWLPSLVFVVFMYPSRLITGWAISRAQRRDTPRHVVFRWSSRLAAMPVVAFYVGFVFFTQYVSWYGRWSLYEQHAFLLPVPFLGM